MQDVRCSILVLCFSHDIVVYCSIVSRQLTLILADSLRILKGYVALLKSIDRSHNTATAQRFCSEMSTPPAPHVPHHLEVNLQAALKHQARIST